MAACSCGNQIVNTNDFMCKSCKATLQRQQMGLFSPQRPNLQSLGAGGSNISQINFSTHPSATHIPPPAGVTASPFRFNLPRRTLPNPFAGGTKQGNLTTLSVDFPSMSAPRTETYPQQSFIDNKGRTVATFGWLCSDQQYMTVDEITRTITTKRNNTEQATVSSIINNLAQRIIIHAAHIQGHSNGGAGARFNLYPVSRFCNLSTMKNHEALVKQLVNNTPNISLNSLQQLVLQVTTAEFNANLVRPYLCNNTDFNKLYNSCNPEHKNMALTIEYIASRIPVELNIATYVCPSAISNTSSILKNKPKHLLQLNINKILEKACSLEQPLYNYQHLTSKKILAANNNFIKNTCSNNTKQSKLFDMHGQSGTTESRGQEMENNIIFNKLKTIFAVPANIQLLHQYYQKHFELDWTYMDTIRQNGNKTMPQYYSCGNQEEADLLAHAFWITGGPLPKARNSRKRKGDPLDDTTNTYP